jgi:hypothetical protein
VRRAEIAALQAGAAEVTPHRGHALPDDIEDSHGTQFEARAAVATEARIDINFNGNRRRGRDLQIPSHLSACGPALRPDRELHTFRFSRHKKNSFFSGNGTAFASWIRGKLNEKWRSDEDIIGRCASGAFNKNTRICFLSMNFYTKD